VKQKADIFQGADSLQNISISMIRTIMDKSKAMADAGIPIVPFVAGEPDFNTPQSVKDAVIRSIRQNDTHYTSNRGYLPLRKAIAQRMHEETGLCYDAETEIVVTSSGAEAINNALISILNPGDEIIVFSPAFVNYENVAKIVGAKVVLIPLNKDNGFQIDVEAVRAAITLRTKLVVINSPCNPTGILYTEETLAKLSALICENNLIAFSDEIYSRLVYGECSFRSLASFPGMKERTLVMNGFSKSFAMTGWRLGYLCADRRMISNMMKVHQYSTTCSPTFIQVGLAEVMNSDVTRREVNEMVKIFSRRRDLVLKGLDQIPNLNYITPHGAFYVFVDVSATGLTGADFAARLLDEKYVAAVPGIGFAEHCTDFVRISYATSDELIVEGMKRLGDFAASL
jgi:aminotransferase